MPIDARNSSSFWNGTRPKSFTLTSARSSVYCLLNETGNAHQLGRQLAFPHFWGAMANGLATRQDVEEIARLSGAPLS